jgi:hypothetical protein
MFEAVVGSYFSTHVVDWISKETEGRLHRTSTQYVHYPVYSFLANITGLPFQTETNTGFGILFKTYLDVTLYQYQNAEGVTEETITSETANSPEAKSAKEDALEFVETNFSSVKLPRQEIERGFRFWDAVSSFFFFSFFIFSSRRWKEG